MLIFLNGVSEISALADKLKEHAEYSKKWSEFEKQNKLLFYNINF